MYANSIQDIGQQTGNLFLGLYSKEYATGIGGAPPARTNGNNPPVISAAGIPCVFMGCEFHETDGLNIFYAEDNAGNLITTWNDINRAIVNMKLVARIPPTNSIKPINGILLLVLKLITPKIHHQSELK